MSSAQQTTIDDLDFPKAVLTRLIKSSLPENIAIQKEARQAVTKAATVFVSYLAATANDCAREGGHKTIVSSDVFKALEAVGLADFIERLQGELAAHAALVRDKKAKAKNKGDGEGDDGDDGTEPINALDDDVEQEGDGTNEKDETAETAVDMASSSMMDVDNSDDENAKRPRID
ncbi:hypothetical protein IW140_005273 [Coemansia sp. RSA 1813]|nr:hypothetical protein EV178_005865 [Coemansia sp. RSA 1646]KAJ1768773.1 hypothetical protein LPJ74_004573 [Coemansia sp. RSA 1843]KAJ2085612.1 hypothetical protein IW138_006221 [Coemansia sp. RSA 986]KAJ2212311.1 hypothetical protein EV179_004781 [Coemansia sp. RSA 487]KAJ2565584.1 hypothetical protein IW140_005273 [Coemansia sp. RSA 1813]